VVSLGHLLFKIMKRYFIIFYQAANGVDLATGNCSMTTNGQYVNRERVTGRIAAEAEKFTHDQITLTNVIELTEEEYTEWRN